ncbi:MAG: APC family permease [Armatimonadetes bacterium]|nr:APC family permease [Armatimonadota bacterium]
MPNEKDPLISLKTSYLGDKIFRRRRNRNIMLRKALGVSGLFSMVYANVGSSIYYALGVTALYALGATPLVFLLAGILFIFTALSYIEGTAAIPEAGGASSFARRGINEFWSFFAGWAQMLDYIITIAISAYVSIGYLAYFYPVLKNHHYHILGAIIVLALLMILNVIGVRESVKFNFFVTIFDLFTQAVLILLGVFLLLNFKTLISQIHWGVAPTWKQLIFSISIVMVAFTGIETVSNMAEEAKSPERNVPRSIYLCVGVVLLIYLGMSSIALSAMPVKLVDGHFITELSTRFLDDPIAGIAYYLPWGAKFMSFWVAFLAFTILVIATNAGLMGISRLTFSMGQHKQLPSALSKIHPKTRTPYIAVIFFSILAMMLLIPADITKLADAYSFGAMLSYAIANISIIALRIKEPALNRPYKLKPNIKIKGVEIPITAVLGAISTFTVWLIVAITHHYGRLIGVPFIIGGILIYIIYRKRHNLPIFEMVKITHKR